MATSAPEVLFGPYVVHESLGTGGMATVHRAELPGIEGFSKQVALKRMLPILATNEEVVKAFVREARLASYLQHVNCAQTYELGNIDGTYFIAMELIQGRSLRDVMDRCDAKQISMPVPIALDILNQVLDALDYAHNLSDENGQRLGIIHRDVSPANILIADGGVVKLIDFGIAKASAVGMQTQSFSVKGKFAYMAPEYVSLGQVDPRADIFAAGVIAHELLTGRPLFSASEDLDTLSRLRSMPIEPPSKINPKVPEDIDGLVLVALARDPAERWSEASALRSALATLTRRLGLGVVGSQLTEWTDDLFDDSRAHRAREVPARMHTPLPFPAVAPPEPAAVAPPPEPVLPAPEPPAQPLPMTAPFVTRAIATKPHNSLVVIAAVAVGLLAVCAAVGFLLL